MEFHTNRFHLKILLCQYGDTRASLEVRCERASTVFIWSNLINSRWSDREERFGVAQKRGTGGRLATIGQEIKNAIKKRLLIVSFSFLSTKRDERRMESHEACLAINFFFPRYRPFPIIFLALMIFKEVRNKIG